MTACPAPHDNVTVAPEFPSIVKLPLSTNAAFVPEYDITPAVPESPELRFKTADVAPCADAVICVCVALLDDVEILSIDIWRYRDPPSSKTQMDGTWPE